MTTDRHACGLTSFLPMSCRGRAEAFARRLQSRLQSLGRQPSEDLNDSEESWLTTSQQPFPTSRQPRLSSSSESDIYFDFDCDFGSPASPQEEATESFHLNKRECGCILEAPQDMESGCATASASATATATSPGSSESSDNNYYDPETQIAEDLAALIDSTLERPCNGFEPVCLDCGGSTACFPQPIDCMLKEPGTEPGTATNETRNETLKTVGSPVGVDEVDNFALRHHYKRLRKPRVDYTRCNGLRHSDKAKANGGDTVTHDLDTKAHEQESPKHELETKGHEEESLRYEVEMKGYEEESLQHEVNGNGHEEESLQHKVNGKGHEEESLQHEVNGKVHEMESLQHEVNGKGHEEESLQDDVNAKGHEEESIKHEVYAKINGGEVVTHENDAKAHVEVVVTHEPEAKDHEETPPQDLKKETEESSHDPKKDKEETVESNGAARDMDEVTEATTKRNGTGKVEDESPLSPTDAVYKRSALQSAEEFCDDTFITSLNILKQEMMVECPSSSSMVPNVEITEASPGAPETASPMLARRHTATGALEVVEEDPDSDDRPQRVRRCSSLKTGKTPPGTPGRKKIVRFADVLGLDLADVRTFLDEVPRVPTSAYDDLQDADLSLGTSTSISAALPSCPRPDKLLVPLFVQPGGCLDFLDRVRDQQVCLENAVVSDPLLFTIAGTVRVRNLDFHKTVHVRYTSDEWRTFSDLQASYSPNSCDGFSDMFTFTLHAHTIGIGQRLEFAVRFQCRGCQYWDSNRGQNYAFQCLPPAGQSPFRSQPMSTCPDEQWASFY